MFTKYFITFNFLISFVFCGQIHSESFYDYFAIGIEGDTISMKKYKNKHILVVNIASKCGFTPQYEDLQKLYQNYRDKLIILGFPSNNFLWQEPGTNEEIKLFCKRTYGVTFQLFEKTHVKGKKKHDIYHWLTNKDLNGWNDKEPSWNFFKYYINTEGKLVKYFEPTINPLDTLITDYFNISLIKKVK